MKADIRMFEIEAQHGVGESSISGTIFQGFVEMEQAVKIQCGSFEDRVKNLARHPNRSPPQFFKIAHYVVPGILKKSINI